MSLVLQAHQISKSYGEQQLFNSFSLKVYSGERIGITGPNGAGKSTLLKVLAGIESPDEGSVRLYTSYSFLRQQDDGVPESMASSLPVGRNQRLMGLLDWEPDRQHVHLSGGEKAKLRFLHAFDPDCGILFADEPTSNLDMESADIVKKELKAYKGTLLLVSHDRDLLDELCDTILEIMNGEVRVFPGNYTQYVRQREAEYQRQVFEYESYIRERDRLKERILERKANRQAIRKAPSRMGNSEARLHRRNWTAIQKKLSQSIDQLETRLEKLEKKEKPRELPQVLIKIEPPSNPVSSKAVRARNLTIGFNVRKLITNATFEIPTGKRTALLGKNGSGKTTLANLIAERDSRLSIAPGVEFGFFKQDFSILDETRSILENVMAESEKPEHEVRGVLARLLIPAGHVHKPVALISGGEKVKVSIARLLVSKANFIILDEPTNYLDVFSLEALESVLKDYTGTLLLISHDRQFVENIAQRLLIIEDNRLKTFEGSLKEYEESIRAKEERTVSSSGLEETIRQMKLAELSAKISACSDESQKQELEAQYQALLKRR
ncbi:MAG TPA: ABC-F type ribosomal protection protein [Thermoclostridium caenicola]|mgnify:FL=1|uniref:ribosomal protection-like ABC-F family protein n=1 Tax=Thermoclostridium caenicola TaxID=659425 RepID=UPI002CAEABAA|nr:ABC-F type ribosomal protection protein [Thermoclostridium caenicola]HOL83739.1 ABC-F type ribosomal protection protein [Thermoclostridium caenicola]HPO75716.1 ABC-F type ribosomal protection protein [Thermoclostridium caenicola]